MKSAILATLQGLVLLLSSPTSYSDQVILDDLIVGSSLCAGIGCADNEAFDFDTVIYKSDDPVVRFQDTSNSSSFPSSDWTFGFTDEGSTVTSYFYLKDVDADKVLLVLESGSDGGIALGADSTVVANAISVGSSDFQRRIMYVANGSDDSDAATMAQFAAFTVTAEANVASDITDLDSDVRSLQSSLGDLQARLEQLSNRIDNLTR
jgi:flagellin-like hook-associated protein FlgL